MPAAPATFTAASFKKGQLVRDRGGHIYEVVDPSIGGWRWPNSMLAKDYSKPPIRSNWPVAPILSYGEIAEIVPKKLAGKPYWK